MTVIVKQLARQIRWSNQTPAWAIPVLQKALGRNLIPPKYLHHLLEAIERADSDDAAVLYAAVLNAPVPASTSSIVSWLSGDVEGRIQYFDNSGFPMSGSDLFVFAFAKWRNEMGNRLVDALIEEVARQNAE